MKIQKAFKEQIREKLLAQRSELTDEIFEHRDCNGVEVDDPVGRSEAELERALDHSIQEGDSRLLQRINHALKRLEQDTYGICEECGEQIPRPRLLAKPSTAHCVSCQETKERMEAIRPKR